MITSGPQPYGAEHHDPYGHGREGQDQQERSVRPECCLPAERAPYAQNDPYGQSQQLSRHEPGIWCGRNSDRTWQTLTKSPERWRLWTGPRIWTASEDMVRLPGREVSISTAGLSRDRGKARLMTTAVRAVQDTVWDLALDLVLDLVLDLARDLALDLALAPALALVDRPAPCRMGSGQERGRASPAAQGDYGYGADYDNRPYGPSRQHSSDSTRPLVRAALSGSTQTNQLFSPSLPPSLPPPPPSLSF